MKLVDILARELKVWPGDVGALTQNSETGELLDFYHCPLRGGNERPALSISHDSGRSHDNGNGASVTRAQWQAAVGALHSIPKFPSDDAEWSGEGLPPVGTVCEFEVETDDWRQCEVIAIKDNYAICWIHVNKIFATGGASVRPLRTPEQIAAEERLHEVRNACTAINHKIEPFNSNIDCSMAIRMTIEAMIDAGYRKFEIVEG